MRTVSPYLFMVSAVLAAVSTFLSPAPAAMVLGAGAVLLGAAWWRRRAEARPARHRGAFPYPHRRRGGRR